MAEVILANLTDISGFATNTVACTGTSKAATAEGIYNVTASGAFAFTLPPAADVSEGSFVIVKDVAGNAATYNITIAAATGNIEGAANVVISSNYGVKMFYWNGTDWSVLI